MHQPPATLSKYVFYSTCSFCLCHLYPTPSRNSFVFIRVFAKVRFKKCICLPHKKTKLPSHQDFGEFALKVKKILQAAPPKLRREMGMCAATIYVQQQQQYYTIRVLVVHTPVSSLSFQVQHTWYVRPGRHAHEPGTSSASCCCNGSVG